jgi:hypothetical protein
MGIWGNSREKPTVFRGIQRGSSYAQVYILSREIPCVPTMRRVPNTYDLVKGRELTPTERR